MPRFLYPSLCLLIAAFAFIQPQSLNAQDAEVPTEVAKAIELAGQSQGIDAKINEVFGVVADWIFDIIFFPIFGMPFIVGWLIIAACTFTVYFGFPNLRFLKIGINVVRGKYDDGHEKAPGEVTHFQALSAALSATVGLGNIAGVAIAISKGGPGATFWMILAGFLGMSSKFVECTLGVKYRTIGEDGKVYGGPMYYLTKGLKKRNLGGLGKVLAVIFAIFCIGGSFGGGNMFQVNQAFTQLKNVTGGEDSFLAGNGVMFGIFIAAIVAVVIIGGIRSIARATSKIVPLMCGIYVTAALAVLFMHFGQIPAAIGMIFTEAFTPDAAVGGAIGCLIIGFQRAAFSNEAGLGSASVAHAAVKTNYPASEGFVALIEPFVDTIVVCTMTALVIIITGEYQTEGVSGVALTSNAFASVISWFPYVLVAAVTLFAFSTMISWSYYGEQAWCYLFGKSNTAKLLYKVLFCIFIVIGAAVSLSGVTDFSDAMILAMGLPNIIGLYILMPEVKQAVKEYTAKINQ